MSTTNDSFEPPTQEELALAKAMSKGDIYQKAKKTTEAYNENKNNLLSFANKEFAKSIFLGSITYSKTNESNDYLETQTSWRKESPERLTQDQLKGIKEFLKLNMKFAPSHDFFHVEYVYNTALMIGQRELESKKDINLFMVELGALFHDFLDHKFTSEEEYKDLAGKMFDFLYSIEIDYAQMKKLMFIMANVSYSKEKSGTQTFDYFKEPELCCVQDADRLAAMGPIGIARTFCFGGERGNPIFDPENSKNTIQHFDDKLLLLYSMLKTETGKIMGKPLHDYMVEFVKQFKAQFENKTFF